MAVRAYGRRELIASGWRREGVVLDLLTGIGFTITAPGCHDHIDFMLRTPSDTALMRQAGGRSWSPRPAVLAFIGADGVERHTVGSYHTYNHSLITSVPSDPIIGPPNITRRGAGSEPQYERYPDGRWREGHHCCFYLIDSRAVTEWERRMHGAVHLAIQLVESQKEKNVGDEIMARYQEIKNMPEWAQQTISHLTGLGALRGHGAATDELGRPADLDLSEDMLRVFSVLDRLGVFGMHDESMS
jgi:hypothetical protein